MERKPVSTIAYIVKTVLLTFGIIVFLSLMLISFSQHKNAFKRADINSPKLTKSQIQKKVPSVKQERQCLSDSIIQNFSKKLPKKSSKGDEELQKIRRTFVLQDESLKQIVIENNDCGANAASWFANLYLDIGLKDKANEYHKIVLNFANHNNVLAMSNLCDFESVATKEQKLHFCNLIIDSKDQKIEGVQKLLAVYHLAKIYFDTDNTGEFFKLCKKAGEWSEVCFMPSIDKRFNKLYGFPSLYKLAWKLYEEKKFVQSLDLFIKIASHDQTGISQAMIAEMYLRGIGTKTDYTEAIAWSKEALERNYDAKLRPEIMNEMCIAYDGQNNLVDSFKCYQQAASMGFASSQMTLAALYTQGHGTIQDYTKAYAWISVSIAQGLKKDKQVDAEKLKNALSYELNKQDKTGIALSKAKNLSQLYYKKYVLHEKPVCKKNINIQTKIKRAISIFSE